MNGEYFSAVFQVFNKVALALNQIASPFVNAFNPPNRQQQPPQENPRGRYNPESHPPPQGTRLQTYIAYAAVVIACGLVFYQVQTGQFSFTPSQAQYQTFGL